MRQIIEKILWRVIRSGIIRRIVKKHNPLQDWPPERAAGDKLSPISRDYGLERGAPVDRYYIERFLMQNRRDIRGRVLEFGDNYYTTKFGGNHVTRSEILYPVEGNRDASIVGDLTTGAGLESESFDCIVCTQVLGYIYDIKAAIWNAREALKPGGVLLVTISTITKISHEDMASWGDYWRVTRLGAKKLFEEVFAPENITVTSYGNVYAATSLLYGVSKEELTSEELDYFDSEYEMLVCVRAVK